MKKKAKTLAILLVFLIGLLIMLYPFISNFRNRMRTENLIGVYNGDVDKTSQQKLAEAYRKARTYNRNHTVNTIVDIFNQDSPIRDEYMSLLNLSGNGMMGYIEIPEIHQRLAIYHGTGDEVLQKGCGHIAGTSLPVGGKSTHSVLAAHRGLPSAKLFTDIDRLKEGDEFYVFVLNHTLAYKVDQIKTVKPDNLDDLQIVKGKDYVTLFTCTPYAVNTHRLLVRGHRVPYVPKDNATRTMMDSFEMYWIIIFVIGIIALAVVVWIKQKERKKMQKEVK